MTLSVAFTATKFASDSLVDSERSVEGTHTACFFNDIDSILTSLFKFNISKRISKCSYLGS